MTGPDDALRSAKKNGGVVMASLLQYDKSRRATIYRIVEHLMYVADVSVGCALELGVASVERCMSLVV